MNRLLHWQSLECKTQVLKFLNNFKCHHKLNLKVWESLLKDMDNNQWGDMDNNQWEDMDNNQWEIMVDTVNLQCKVNSQWDIHLVGKVDSPWIMVDMVNLKVNSQLVDMGILLLSLVNIILNRTYRILTDNLQSD